MEDLDGLIQQIYRDQDLTQGEEVPSQSYQAGPEPSLLWFSEWGHNTPLFPQGGSLRTASGPRGSGRVR